jgi:heat shock protein HslJ
MACQPDVMESEQAFLSVLQRPLTLARDGDTLAMMGEGVELEFSIIPPVEPTALAGTTWQLETVIIGEAATSVRGHATLVLNEDGTMEGSTGCRDLSGTYAVDGDELVFTELAAAGDCPADLAEQDGRVISVLEAARIEIDGNHLRLRSAGGEGLDYLAAS